MRTVLKLSLLLVAAAIGLSSTAWAQGGAPLKAGAAAVDISPKELPLNLPGGFSANMAERINDPLHARALVLQSGDTTVALVVVDNLGVAPDVIEAAKEIASKKTGIPVNQMLVCSTHTHSAPASGVTEGPAPAVAYRELILNGIAQSIVDAHAKLRPARVGAAKHELPEEVFNRRWYLKPGKMPLNPFGQLDTVKMNPGTSRDVIDRPAGPTDPDLMILSVQDERGRPLALWANYALHYVGGVPRGVISADYFGEFARVMPSRLRAGDDFVAMMSNGCSGDINNVPFGVTRPPRAPFEQIRIVAQKAADTAWFAHGKIGKHQDRVPLEMVERKVVLKYRRPTEEQVAAARKVLAITDEAEKAKLPNLAENYARNVIRLHERKEDTLTVKLQALRVGDLAICGIPFETFCEIGLDVKNRSPFAKTMVIGLANGRYGYLPTPEQHRLGGYETWLGTNVVQEDTSVILANNLEEMLKELAD
jgi:neutral ceramidase